MPKTIKIGGMDVVIPDDSVLAPEPVSREKPQRIDAPSSAGVAPSRSRVNNSRPTP
jgi:hypothetical protein